MIPLFDSNPTKNPAVVTVAIILLNTAVFFVMSASPDFNKIIFEYGAIPVELIHSVDIFPFIPLPVYVTALSSMFMHAGLFHLIGNMLFLWIFGDNVEDIFGHGRFVIFYLICGVGALVAHILQYGPSTIPLVGASGAISGLLGAYLLAFPRARVYTLFWFVIFIRIIPLPAWVVIGFWFFMQVLNMNAGGQVAWGAHVGGFFTGVALYPAFRFLRWKEA